MWWPARANRRAMLPPIRPGPIIAISILPSCSVCAGKLSTLAARDGQQLVPRSELHTRALLLLAAAELVGVDRAPALGGHELRLALRQERVEPVALWCLGPREL